MKLKTLIAHLFMKTWLVKGNPTIYSLEMDSRKVTDGSLFFCLKGFTVDGHDYAEKAVQNGAVALIVERPVHVDVPTIQVKDSQRAMAILAAAFYEFPTNKFPLIGITGTNGKTTTSYIIDKIFEDTGKRVGRIGTINTKINEVEYDIVNTTPESLPLQKMFHEMVSGQTEVAVMEVSSHALHLGRVRGCNFQIAVFTNLSQDHLDYHGTMEEYKQAKGILFSQLGNTYNKNRKKYAILNRDDKTYRYFDTITAAEVITYGIEHGAQIQATEIHLTNEGTTFQLKTPFGNENIFMKLVGKFNVYNALAASAACLASGIPLGAIKRSLAQLSGVPGRFELIDEGQPFTVLVDYAHTPDSLLKALTTIKEFVLGKIIIVVGCGGDRDKEKRPLMGKIAVEHADIAVFTSDNPRSEDPLKIIQEMTVNITHPYETIVDRKKAIHFAIEQAAEGDVVLIAGKGHETEQIIGENTFYFDDRVVAREMLARLFP